jgi:hypothetical protein
LYTNGVVKFTLISKRHTEGPVQPGDAKERGPENTYVLSAPTLSEKVVLMSGPLVFGNFGLVDRNKFMVAMLKFTDPVPGAARKES